MHARNGWNANVNAMWLDYRTHTPVICAVSNGLMVRTHTAALTYTPAPNAEMVPSGIDKGKGKA